jgi:hypothetical protein
MTRGRFTSIGAFIVALHGLAVPAGAYELRTHREMATRAFNQAANVAAYLDAVGMKPDDKLDPTHDTGRWF